MVAVVTGSTAGLNTSSLATLGSQGGLGNAATGGRGGDKVFVNAVTGNLTVQRQDDFLMTLGTDLPSLNTYNSLGQATGFDNADKWQFFGSKRLWGASGVTNHQSGSFKRVDGDGSEQTFTWDGSRYVSTDGDGSYDTFSWDGAQSRWIYTDGATGDMEAYTDFTSNNGQIAKRTTAEGKVVDYLYSGTNLIEIKAATADAGGLTDSLVISYSGNNITQIAYVKKNSAGAAQETITRTRYGYDGSNRLLTITTDLTPADNSIATGPTYVTTFRYIGSSQLVDQITQTDGSQINIAYDGSNRVQTITDGLNRTTTFAYNTAARTATITDALSQATVITYDTSNRLSSVQGPSATGSQTTTFGYDSWGNVTSITDAKGQVTYMTYDTARGNLLTKVDAAGNTMRRTYETSGARNLVLTEAFFAVPDATPANGSMDASSPLVTRYVYETSGNLQRLRYVLTPQGRVTEYQYDNNGNRVAAIDYAENFYNLSGVADNSSVAQSAVDAWRSGGSVDRTKTIRTDYAYDLRGQLTTATRWASVNASGVGVNDGNQTITTYQYSYAGQLLQTADTRNNVTAFTYDGLGRLLTRVVTPASGLGAQTTTTYVYDDANRKVETTFANGLKTTAVYDQAGELLSVANTDTATSTAMGTTNYYYDAAGRLIMVKDPLGVHTHSYYDASGRKVADVDGDGSLTEYVYNANNQVYKTIRYATAVSVASLVDGSGNPAPGVTLASIRPTANLSADRYVFSVYDLAGRLAFQQESVATGGTEKGAITRYEYDGASRLVRVTQRATLSTQELQGSGEISATSFAATYDVTPSADDRATRNFYDLDGRLLGVLDAEGYLTENLYSAAGQLKQTIRYATLTASGYWVDGTLAQLRPNASPIAVDIVTSYLYDSEGRNVGVVDGQNYLTETQYDRDGNVTQVIRYNTPVTYSASSTISSIRPSGTSHATTFQYDGYNRVVQETNFESTATAYVYDSVGNLTSKTVGSGADLRQTQKRYDVLGRVTQELTAEGSAAIAGGMAVATAWTQYSITHTYDQAGNRTSTTDQNGNKTWFYYDADNRLCYVIDHLGNTEDVRYNVFGERVRRQQLFLSPAYFQTATTAQMQSDIDQLPFVPGPTTYMAYTRRGELRSVTTAALQSTTSQFNAFSQESSRVTQINATENLEQSFSYSRRGFLTQTRSDPNGLNATENRQYDAFGRLISLKDAKQVAAGGSAVTAYEYDKIGQVIKVTDTLGRVSDFTYDAYGRRLTVEDARGNATVYSYNDAARSMTMTTPEGIAVTTVHNAHGQTVTVTEANGHIVTTGYDANGRVVSTTDNFGSSTVSTSTYDKAGRLLTSTDANGVVTTLTYDAANRVLTRTLDAAGLNQVTSFVYNAQGQVTQVTDANGTVTTTAYDLAGRITDIVVDPGATPAHVNAHTRYTYDKTGNQITVTEGYGSANPRTTQYTYDKLGRRTQEVVDPGTGKLNLTTTYAYDLNNNVVRKTAFNKDAAGTDMNSVTRYVYDDGNRLIYTVDSLSGVTQYTYGNGSTVVKRYANAASGLPGVDLLTATHFTSTPTPDTARDRIEQTFLDKDGRVKYVINSLGGVTRRYYNSVGLLEREVAYLNTLSPGTVYASTAAVDAAIAPSGSDTLASAGDADKRYVYNTRGWLRYELQAYGMDGSNNGLYTVKVYSYDSVGNIKKATEAASAFTIGAQTPTLAEMGAWVTANADVTNDRATLFWYDAANRLRFKLDGEGYITESRYDDVQRTTTEVAYVNKPSSQGITLTTSTTTSQVASWVSFWSDGWNDVSVTTFRDAAGRTTRLRNTWAGGYFENNEYFEYDALGNRTKYTNGKGSIWTYQYDANGRLIDEVAPGVNVTTVNDSGAALTTPAQETNVALVTHMVYDALGNLLSRTEAYGRGDARTTSFAYDVLGRQVKTTYPAVYVWNGASDGTASNSEYWVTNLYTQVTYDTLGNAVASRDLNGNLSYKGYDQLGRLIYDVDQELQVTQYGYDNVGNQTLVKRFANKLTSTPPAIPKLGDLSSRVSGDSANDRTVTKTYDRANRVSSIGQDVVPTLDFSGNTFTNSYESPLTTYEYNAYGQVIREDRRSHLGNSYEWVFATTYYYYDRAGRLGAVVDPMGYLTVNAYDERGNLTARTEYAKPLSTGTWNQASYGTPPTPSANDPAGQNRVTYYTYDSLDRLIQEARVEEYGTVTGGVPGRTTGNVITTYGYDAAGNRTKVTDNSGTTYTYYDALGRVIGVASAERDLGNGGAVLRSLVELRRNAAGDLVHQIQYSVAPTSAGENTFTPPSSDTGKRETRLLVDALGRVKRVEDALGNDRYSSYTRAGDIAKEWQPVATNEGDGLPTVTVHIYDKVGQETEVRNFKNTYLTSDKNGSITNYTFVRTNYKYNSFGELTDRGIDTSDNSIYGNGTYQEHWNYDKGGRVWRTNADDGVYRVYLYNLAGQVTAEIRGREDVVAGSGDRNIANLSATSGSHVAQGWGTTNTIRTEYTYDLNGQLVYTKLPTFSQASLIDGIAVTPAISTMVDATNVNAGYVWSGSYGWDYYGNNWSTDAYTWNPRATNAVYYFSNGWQSASTYTPPTISRVMHWVSPANAYAVIVRFRVTGSSTWATAFFATTVQDPTTGEFRLGVNIGSLAQNTNYDYKIEYWRDGEDANSQPSLIQTGTISNLTANSGTVGASTTQTTLAGMEQFIAPSQSRTVDRWGNALSVTDPTGNTTNFRYDQRDRLIETKLPAALIRDTRTGSTTNITGGNLVGGRAVRENFFDQMGNLIATRDGNGNVNRATFNAAGDILQEFHADGGTKSYRYNLFGENTLVTDEEGFDTRYDYDALGQLTGISREATSNGIVNGVVDTAQLANVVVQNYAYDAAGRRISETTGARMDDYSIYTSTNTDDHASAEETYRYYYDRLGNLVKRRTPQSYDTTMAYDIYGRMTSETNPLGSARSWTYNYFGQLQQHSELSTNGQSSGSTAGATYTNTYNPYTGQLKTTTNTFSAGNISYDYDNAGHLRSITDVGTTNTAGATAGLQSTNTTTFYQYDAAGRRVKERTTRTASGADIVHQNVRITYDSQGRVAYLWDSRYNTKFEYDAEGNVTHNQTRYTFDGAVQLQQMWMASDYSPLQFDPSPLHTFWGTQDLWYKHDAMNRVVLARGANVSNTVSVASTQGILMTYDEAGQRTSAENYGDKFTLQSGSSYTKSHALTHEDYAYDGLGRLKTVTKDGTQITSNTYDKASRVTNTAGYRYENQSGATYVRKSFSDTTRYDDEGRPWIETKTTSGLTTAVVQYGTSTALYGTSSYNGTSWSFGFDSTGTLRGYRVGLYSNGSFQYNEDHALTYRAGETYDQTGETSAVSGGTTTSTTRTYDVNGNLVAFRNNNDTAKSRYFALDAAGNPLTVVQGNYGSYGSSSMNQALERGSIAGVNPTSGTQAGSQAHQRFYFANGRHTGTSGNLTGLLAGEYETPKADFDLNFEAVGSDNPGETPTTSVAQEGDTLRILAQRIYGDGNLWYLLADESGLTDPDAPLEAGTVVTTPPAVANRANTTFTYTPFDISNALGDTTPVQPRPPPPKKKKGCGILGKIIMVVVAVVVTVYTAGAAAGAMGSTIAATSTTAATAASTAGAWAAGTAALTGGLTSVGAGIAAAAIGGAVGSIASQAVGIATGVQDGFNWKGVALGAIGAGVGAGLGGSSAFGSVLNKVHAVAGDVGQLAVHAATANALTQGIGVATGLQSKFSWRDVAISAVAAPIANGFGKAVGPVFDNSVFAQRVVGGLAGSGVRAALGGKVDAASAVADAFGNALGNAIVDRRVTPAIADIEEIQVPAHIQRRPDAAVAGDVPITSNPANTVAQTGFIQTADQQRVAAGATAQQQTAARAQQSAVESSRLGESGVAAEIDEIVVTAKAWSDQQKLNYDQYRYLGYSEQEAGRAVEEHQGVAGTIHLWGVKRWGDMQAAGRDPLNGVLGALKSVPNSIVDTIEGVVYGYAAQNISDTGARLGLSRGEIDNAQAMAAAKTGAVADEFTLAYANRAQEGGAFALEAGTLLWGGATLVRGGLRASGALGFGDNLGGAANATSREYGVAFFGKDSVEKYYLGDNVSIGNPNGEAFFFMPLDDAAMVRNAGDAARYSGMAPSAQRAYLEGGDIFGISFPTDGMKVSLPTAADARGWPHFLEGGHTAVRLEGANGGYLVNPTREFVVPGGSPPPAGTVVFKIDGNGAWVPVRKF